MLSPIFNCSTFPRQLEWVHIILSEDEGAAEEMLFILQDRSMWTHIYTYQKNKKTTKPKEHEAAMLEMSNRKTLPAFYHVDITFLIFLLSFFFQMENSKFPMQKKQFLTMAF